MENKIKIRRTIYVTNTAETPSVPLVEISVEEIDGKFFASFWSCTEEKFEDRERKPFETYGAALTHVLATGLDVAREFLKPQKIILKVK